MGVGETITVINKSGKVVSSSKHLVHVFKEAKSAYRERKAEIKAERSAAAQERKLREGIGALRIDDDDDVQSRASKHSKAARSSPSHRHRRPPLERGFTDGLYADRDSRVEGGLASHGREAHRKELVRRNIEWALHPPPARDARRCSEDMDMDLAYGDIPPPLPMKRYGDDELCEKASKLTMLLDEANCLQHSVTSTIENLQRNPDALAAVALTLAEISNLVGKMGPGVLLTLKRSFPAVVALLVSPQFMIAAGVGVGVTMVALGGYKIIKKIQAQREEQRLEEPFEAAGPLQLDELELPELSRIDLWRRGIADAEAEGEGTIVDGEFITPGASRQLVAAGVLDEEQLRLRRSAKTRDDGERRSKSHKPKSSRTSKTARTPKSSAAPTKAKEKTKKKDPSPLKTLFRSHTHS